MLKKIFLYTLLCCTLCLSPALFGQESVTNSGGEGVTADDSRKTQTRPYTPSRRFTASYADTLRRLLDRYQPSWSNVRMAAFGMIGNLDYQFYNFGLNYDYFNGGKSMYHLSLGYVGSDLISGVDAAGFNAGFLYGAVLSRKHYRDGATAFSLDMGGIINHIDVDGRDDSGNLVTGKLHSYEFHLGPRFDLFLRIMPQRSIIDMWFSTYLHLIAGYKDVEKIENGMTESSVSGEGVGFSWGLLLSTALINIDMEIGSFRETFLRLGLGFAISL